MASLSGLRWLWLDRVIIPILVLQYANENSSSIIRGNAGCFQKISCKQGGVMALNEGIAPVFPVKQFITLLYLFYRFRWYKFFHQTPFIRVYNHASGFLWQRYFDARQHTRASELSSSSLSLSCFLQRAMHFGHNSRMHLSHKSQIDEIKLKGTGTGW